MQCRPVSPSWPWKRRRSDHDGPEGLAEDEHASPRVDLLLSSDHPIDTGEEDRLGRRPFAELVAAEIAAAPRVGGFVTAVTGSWGSGKTSVINMVVEDLEAQETATVLVFNPWLFSGTERLAEHFFRELGTQLGEADDHRLAGIGERLSIYGQLVGPIARAVPAVGGNLELASTSPHGAGAVMHGTERSLRSLLTQLTSELTKLRRPIVVIVDDLDRLGADEVREVVRLVRLAGDFPNVVYLLGFDRARVERALGEGKGQEQVAEGRAYLEKIVQVSHELPPLEAERLTKLTEEAVSRAIGRISGLTLDPEAFLDVFALGIRPMIETVRDVRRYANLLASRVRLLGAQVEVSDVLALEAIRVFAPDSHNLIGSSREALTTPASSGVGAQAHDESDRAQIAAIVEAAGDRRDAVEELIRQTFPAAARHFGEDSHFGPGWLPTWHRTRRVAHREILDIYLTRTVPAGIISAQEAKAVFTSLEDRAELEQRLARLDEGQLEVMLERLEHHHGDFPSERPEVPIAVLLNQLERLRAGRRGLYDAGAEVKLPRVVLRLLSRLAPGRVEEIVRAALPEIGSLSARMELIDLVGHREGVGRGLIAEEAAIQLEAEHVRQILGAHPDALSEERHVTPLIARACEWDLAAGRKLGVRVAQDDRRLVRLLRGATAQRGGGKAADPAEPEAYELNWQGLSELLGEQALIERMEALPKGAEGKADARARAGARQARLHARDLSRERVEARPPPGGDAD